MIVASRDLADPLTVEHEAAMRRAAKRCPMPGCGVKFTDRPFLPNSKELDHVVPRCLGGAHTIGNTRIICRLCNARRPDDGSDIEQMSLFSTLDPAAVAVALAPRIRQPGPQHRPRTCACGAPSFKSSPRGWCEGCRARIASEASAMRAEGAKWQDVSDALGLGGPGAAHNLVTSYAAAA